MTQSLIPPLAAVLAGCALLIAGSTLAQSEPSTSTDANVPPATAQKQAAEISHGDPARWYKADTSVDQRLRTLQKEIGAGLQEAQGACRKLAASERAACMQQARTPYTHDRSQARQRAIADSR